MSMKSAKFLIYKFSKVMQQGVVVNLTQDLLKI